MQRIVVDELRRAAFIGGQEGLPADFAFEFAALDCARERFADLSFEWRQLLGQFDAQIEKSAVDAFQLHGEAAQLRRNLRLAKAGHAVNLNIIGGLGRMRTHT